MNGIEFLKELRIDENLKNISVFVMTTSNEDSDKVMHITLMSGYILKALSFRNLSPLFTRFFWSLYEDRSIE
jgi:DNA-binding response OmpR family regulator